MSVSFCFSRLSGCVSVECCLGTSSTLFSFYKKPVYKKFSPQFRKLPIVESFLNAHVSIVKGRGMGRLLGFL